MENKSDIYSENSLLAIMSEKSFHRLSEFISARCGIKMPGSKKVMLEARLRRRLRHLDMKSFSEYCDYLFSPEGMMHEVPQMINEITTNKTDFFREMRHFDYLVQTVLPELINLCGAGSRRMLNIWSAGCSTGEEPYTIAMVLNEFAEKYPGFNFLIIATDISTKVLNKAARGIYAEDSVEPVPMTLKKKYLLRGKDKNRGLVRVRPELRAHVKFRRLNFMDGDFGMREPMDIIFCRNVIIYFDRPTQEKLLNRLYNHLVPGGYVFMGHSETLNSLNIPLVLAAPTVYRKPL